MTRYCEISERQGVCGNAFVPSDVALSIQPIFTGGLTSRRRIREIARSRVRYGYKRMYVMLAREGIHINDKPVYRLCCEEGLQLGAKHPRLHVSAAHW